MGHLFVFFETPTQTRKQVMNNEQLKNKAAQVKRHLQDNKRVYLGVAGGTALGAVGMFAALHGGQMVDSMKLVHIQYKSPNINIALVRKACPEPIPVLDKLTGEAYPSLRRASTVTGNTLAAISNDAQGAQARFEMLPHTVFA
jgi:hypothetical protein